MGVRHTVVKLDSVAMWQVSSDVLLHRSSMWHDSCSPSTHQPFA